MAPARFSLLSVSSRTPVATHPNAHRPRVPWKAERTTLGTTTRGAASAAFLHTPTLHSLVGHPREVGQIHQPPPLQGSPT
jgi:hypothetical protein